VGAQLGMDDKAVEKYIGSPEKQFLVRQLPALSRNTLIRLIVPQDPLFGCRTAVRTDTPDT